MNIKDFIIIDYVSINFEKRIGLKDSGIKIKTTQ